MTLTGLSGITLTGVDAGCDLARAQTLSTQFPLAEWGVLYSPKRAGKEGRYPTLVQVRDLLTELHHRGMRSALHLCGQAVGDALAGDADMLALMALAGRIQLNFNQSRAPLDLGLVDALADRLQRPVITQHNAANASVHQALSSPFHQVLFDASGGAGVAPERWPEPLPGKLCGYAGGLGPGVVAEALAWIPASSQPFWIDMETKLRDAADRLELDRCQQVLAEAAAFLGVGPAAKPRP